MVLARYTAKRCNENITRHSFVEYTHAKPSIHAQHDVLEHLGPHHGSAQCAGPSFSNRRPPLCTFTKRNLTCNLKIYAGEKLKNSTTNHVPNRGLVAISLAGKNPVFTEGGANTTTR